MISRTETTHMADKITDYGGLVIEFGVPVKTIHQDVKAYWQNRRVMAMNLLSRNKEKNVSEWILYLDCDVNGGQQHTIRETLDYDESPKGWYRDCPKRQH